MGQWLKGHTSFMKPVHRYEGTLWWEQQSLLFSGWDKKQRQRIDFRISRDTITDVAIGFDQHFGRMLDRQLGLFGFKPLIVRYRSRGKVTGAYLFARFSHGRIGIRRAKDNQRWLAFLQERVTQEDSR